jgi:hypothetical protein
MGVGGKHCLHCPAVSNFSEVVLHSSLYALEGDTSDSS